jgi:hypothetical protein
MGPSNMQAIIIAVLEGAAALVLWEACVALVARRRPVPLIFFAIGVIAAAVVAAFLLAARALSTQQLLIASVATGFAAAIGVAVIWQLTQERTPGGGGTRTASRVGRTFVIRGLVFSMLVFLLTFMIRVARP